jgi:hypothetical protein
MAVDELRAQAMTRVQADNPGNTDFKVSRVYENLMDGTLITVSFRDSTGKEDFNHVHFTQAETRTYRWHNEVLTAIANYKERVLFFRFLDVAGISGLIALTLIIIFSVFLFVLAFSRPDTIPTIVEVVKLSFTTILGFFFGSQVPGKR